MMEKRFWSKDYSAGYYTEIVDNDKELEEVPNPKKNLSIGEVVDLLNELAEEKKDLEEARSYYQENFLTMKTERNQLKKENKELKKQLRREETDKKRLMSYLMRYKGFGFDEIVEDFLDNSYYDNWWEDGFYECCWDEYLKEKGFNGGDLE